MHSEIKQGNLKSYIIGFTLSFVLTLMAYFIVVGHLFSNLWIIISIVILGLIQAAVQLILFLYLGKERRPRSNFLVFLFMSLVLAMVVFGTLWIMYDLNQRVMPQMEMSEGI